MLSTTLLALTLFAAPVETGLSEGGPTETAPTETAAVVPQVVLRAEVFAAEQPARRDRAAEVLELALDGERSLAALVAAGDAARRELLDGETSRSIERAVSQARWSALLDAGRAARELSRTFEALISDLTFRPYIEAELPEGFPIPTMVGEIELRSYPRYRMATAPMDGGRSNTAFWKLFEHITTNDIPMTAPVETTFEMDGDRVRATTMAFLYEGPEQGQAGHDGSVDVIDADAQLVVSMGMRGNDARSRVDAAHARLLEWIAAQPELELDGDMRTMGYNSPMVRGSRRTFEVQVPVRLRVTRDV